MIRALWLLLTLHVCLHAEDMLIKINHQYEGRPVHLDSFRYKLADQQTYSLTRLSYLLSEFKLETLEGDIIELKDQVAWIDLKKSDSFILTDIPKGKYRALHYAVGLDKITNHSDPQKYPIDHPLSSLKNMHWDLAGGYIFLAIEGHYLTADTTTNAVGKTGFVYHLANDENLTSITLPHSLDISKSIAVEIAFDLQSIFNSPNALSFLKDGNISHSGKKDTVAKKLSLNLKNTFSIKSVSISDTDKKPIEKLKPLYMPVKITPYRFVIPRSIPVPDLPRDNPLTIERVNLGKILFNDPRLSKDNTISCASCHQQENGFTDSRTKSLGVGNTVGLRNSMPLQNLAWKSQFFWDGRVSKLRDQVLIPIQDKTEMHQDIELLPAKLTNLKPNFKAAFASEDITPEKIALALETHLLTLTSLDSKFDQSMKGKATLTEQEKRGFQLFFTENNPRQNMRGADCFHCHSGPFFTDAAFHDTGLPSPADTGLHRLTGKQSDISKFLTPSLRNVELTAPYMHDGRLKTLEEVIDHYDHTHTKTPNLDPNLSKHRTTGLQLTAQDKADLVAYLKTLTDPKFKK